MAAGIATPNGMQTLGDRRVLLTGPTVESSCEEFKPAFLGEDSPTELWLLHSRRMCR
jgi:hypothetical protein